MYARKAIIVLRLFAVLTSSQSFDVHNWPTHPVVCRRLPTDDEGRHRQTAAKNSTVMQHQHISGICIISSIITPGCRLPLRGALANKPQHGTLGRQLFCRLPQYSTYIVNAFLYVGRRGGVFCVGFLCSRF